MNIVNIKYTRSDNLRNKKQQMPTMWQTTCQKFNIIQYYLHIFNKYVQNNRYQVQFQIVSAHYLRKNCLEYSKVVRQDNPFYNFCPLVNRLLFHLPPVYQH
jgi:hypothetical protein